MEAEPLVEMQRRTIGWFWMHSEPRTSWRSTRRLLVGGVAPLMARAAKRATWRCGNGPFEYDLVDVTRQAMANLFFDAHVVFEWPLSLLLQEERTTAKRLGVGRRE
jgi:hypothetical protein